MYDNGIWGVLILEETVKFFPTVYQIVLVFNVLCIFFISCIHISLVGGL